MSSLDLKIFFMAIFFVIFGIILGISSKDGIYAKYHTLRKNIKANKKKIIIFALIFSTGISIGILIMLFSRSNSISLLIEWISGLGTWAAVVVSLWLATGRKSRLKINHDQNIDEPGPKKIYFIAYNLSDKSISLEFYGVKKAGDKLFYREKNLEPEVVKAGEFQKRSLKLDIIEANLKISDSYKGDIVSCFAEPDGNLHCEVINWKEEMARFEKANQKLKLSNNKIL